jgi:hypothetical protein
MLNSYLFNKTVNVLAEVEHCGWHKHQSPEETQGSLSFLYLYVINVI